MRKRSLVLVLFLLSLVLFARNFSIQQVRALGPIYIREDGSVDPSTSPLQRNGDLYTVIEDFFAETDGIIIERSGITLDGVDHTLTGSNQPSQKGIVLLDVQYVTVKNFEIESFASGIFLNASSHNIIEDNHILNNHYRGIAFFGVNEENLITQNTLSGNAVAIGPHEDGDLLDSVITQNEIVENTVGLSGGTEGHSWINNTIGDNIISDNVEAAIAFIHYKSAIEDNTIVRNEIRNNGEGISLYFTCPNTTIRDNTIADNNGIGFCSFYSITNAVILGNLIEGNLGGLQLSSYIAGVAASNNLISENVITMNHEYGILLAGVSENTITNNVISHNINGFILTTYPQPPFNEENGYLYSDNNVIVENQISQNANYGVQLINASGNSLYHNNFIDNTIHVASEASANTWNDGYPSGGNYWSGYSGDDLYHGPDQDIAGSDGIGDAPFIIDEPNQDTYPFINPITSNSFIQEENYSIDISGESYDVTIISNSATSAFVFNPSLKEISFTVIGDDDTGGFCSITFPTVLLEGPYSVFIDGIPVTSMETSNTTHTSLYLSYVHSTHTVEIIGTAAIPEFPPIISITLLLIIVAVSLLNIKRNRYAKN